MQTLCLLALSHVEANGACTVHGLTHRSCLVTHVRPSRRLNPSRNYTPFDNPATLQNFLDKRPKLHAALAIEDPWP